MKYAEAIASIGGEARDAAFHAVLHVNPRRLDALAACVANRSADARRAWRCCVRTLERR